MMTERKLYEHEPMPDPNAKAHPAIWDLVLADLDPIRFRHVVTDICERDAYGMRKYGQRLRPFDGRDNLKDAYQEALDLVVYLRKEIYQLGERAIGFKRHYDNALEIAHFLRERIFERDGR